MKQGVVHPRYFQRPKTIARLEKARHGGEHDVLRWTSLTTLSSWCRRKFAITIVLPSACNVEFEYQFIVVRRKLQGLTFDEHMYDCTTLRRTKTTKSRLRVEPHETGTQRSDEEGKLLQNRPPPRSNHRTALHEPSPEEMRNELADRLERENVR